MPIDVVWLTAQKRTGVTIQAENLATALDDREEFDVTLMSADSLNTGHHSSYVEDDSGFVYPVESIVPAMEQLEPDIIMMHHLSNEVLNVVDLLKEMSVLVTRLGVNLREYLLLDAKDYDKVGQFTRAFQASDLLVSSSPRTTQDIISMGISKDRIVEIPSAIDVEENEVVSPTDEKKGAVGSIGRLGKVKNQFTLVQAVTMFRDLDTEVNPKYVLAGKPNDRSWQGVEEFSRVVSPSNVMDSMGWVDDPLKDFYPEIDIHLLSSWTENCPVSILEAAIAGVPSIVADLSWQRAYPEIEFPSANPDDPSEWAQAIHELYADDELRVELAKEQQEAVLEHYTMDSAIDQYEDVLREAFFRYRDYKLDDVSGLRRGVYQ